MTIALNHTIVHSKNAKKSAQFLADILGLPAPKPFAHFQVVETQNGVSLDFTDDSGNIVPQHYAFLVSEDEFDTILGRIKERGITFWATPLLDPKRPNEINHNDGGRGTYFEDPNGHVLEILTRPYGSGA